MWHWRIDVDFGFGWIWGLWLVRGLLVVCVVDTVDDFLVPYLASGAVFVGVACACFVQ
jgi:hypothetical protein